MLLRAGGARAVTMALSFGNPGRWGFFFSSQGRADRSETPMSHFALIVSRWAVASCLSRRRMRSSWRSGAEKRCAASKPCLEPLEGRAVPSTAYNIVELGNLGGGAADATALNNRGEVVGYSKTRTGAGDGFLYRNGKMKSLGSFQATGINNRGQIVGWSWSKKGLPILALLDSGGRKRAIGKTYTFNEHIGPTFSINDRGQIIGFSSKHNDAQLRSGGRLKDLGSLNDLGSIATGINDQGAVVGYSYLTPYTYCCESAIVHPFVYQHGHMTDLGTLGGSSAAANAIAADGDIVGWSSTKGNATDAFLDHNGKMIDLGNFGTGYATATAVNDQGQVVGLFEAAPRRDLSKRCVLVQQRADDRLVRPGSG